MPDSLVIERFEDDLARVEWQGRPLDLPRAWLPQGVHAGDHVKIHIKGTGQVRFEIDQEATTRAQRDNQQALNALNVRDDGGDLDL